MTNDEIGKRDVTIEHYRELVGALLTHQPIWLDICNPMNVAVYDFIEWCADEDTPPFCFMSKSNAYSILRTIGLESIAAEEQGADEDKWRVHGYPPGLKHG